MLSQEKQPLISVYELIDSYKESLGEEGAKELIKEAVRKASLFFKKEYTKEETIKILNILQEEEGFIGILASILVPRIIVRNK